MKRDGLGRDWVCEQVRGRVNFHYDLRDCQTPPRGGASGPRPAAVPELTYGRAERLVYFRHSRSERDAPTLATEVGAVGAQFLGG